MKSALKGLSVLVLIGISVCFAVIYYNTFLREKVFADNDEGIDGVQTEPIQKPNQGDVQKPIEQDPTPIVPVFRTELPRSANKLVNGYINNVGGYGIETLYDCYKLGERYTAIISTTSDNCDIRENGSGIAIANFDGSGSLLTTYSLKSSKREKYLCSSLYDNGIMIVTSDQSNIVIHQISLDGNVSKLNLSSNAEKAISYYTSIGTVVACFGNKNIEVFCISASLNVIYNVSFANEGMSEGVALFKSGNFVLFANGTNGGKIFSFDLNGNSSSINLSTIKDVLPNEEGYLIATTSNGKIFLNRYSYALSALGTSELASGENVKLGSAETGYYAIVYGGGATASYYLCKHFDTVSVNRSDYIGVSSVGEMITANDKIYFVASLRGDSYIYEYNTNNHIASPVLTLQNSENLKYFLHSGYDSAMVEKLSLTMFFASTNTIGDYANNFGSSDVWMKRYEF